MKKLTAFILAGGKSQRMGQDKAACKIGDETFISAIAKKLNKVADEVILVSNDSEHDKFQLKRIPDVYPHQGPIAGIHAALTFTTTENNLILSCDVPLISSELIQKLLIEKNQEDVIYLATEKDEMPLIGLYKKSCTAYFQNKLESNELRLMKALAGLNSRKIVIAPEDEYCIKNINTPEDLKQINNDL